MSAAKVTRGRPKVGVGVFVLSDAHSGCVLLGIRKGSSGEARYGLPGGHLEFGESWEECGSREVLEECGSREVLEECGSREVLEETWEECGSREVLEETGLKLKDVQYCTVVNGIHEEENYHYVDLFVKGTVDTRFQTEPENLEPDKCSGWEWTEWGKFPPSDKLFCPLRALLEQGYSPFEHL